MKTLRLVREKYPEMICCLATNGLGIGPYIDELAEINVSHVTITVNAIDPDIGSQIYSFVRHGKRVLTPREGFNVLLEKQLEAIQRLKEKNVTTKINTIIIPGINEDHIEAVAKKMSGMGVDILNCVPFYPNEGAAFAHLEEPSKETVAGIRKKAARYLPQMLHCKRCRADAVGILGENNSAEIMDKLRECAELPEISDETRPMWRLPAWRGFWSIRSWAKPKNFSSMERKTGKLPLLRRERRPRLAPA